jgi:Spy/CpxP family protein refolding chaperone
MKASVFLKCAVLSASVLVATIFQAAAQGQGGGGGRGGMGILTQDQRAKISDTIQSELSPLMEKLAAAQKEAVKTALDPKATEDAIKAKFDAVSKIQTDMAMLRLKGLKAIAPTLTDEQKTQLANARDGGYMTLFGGMGGRGGRGGGRPGGGNN